MCGITTIISQQNNTINTNFLTQANDIIKHRGPDGGSIYLGSNFGMAHRRLAIIDLSEDGIQPMQRHNLVITFNGEIFNYIELRAELTKAGYFFETATDTEVILQAYRYWGEDCQNHFIGMWAFVLFDPSKNLLFCSRDRFFQKPFLYTICGEHFMIGSEIKQFTTHPEFKAILDLDTTYDFLEHQKINHSSATFFKNVYSLDGGHQLIYNLKSHQFNITKWYNPVYSTNKKISFEEAKNTYTNLLKDSIKIRLRSDVIVGVALSGGIDSSGITCIAHEIDKEGTYKAITSCYTEAKYNELYYAQCVTKKTNFNLKKKYPILDKLLQKGVLDKMVWHQEQPIPSVSHFSEYSVFEYAKDEGITVMLCGQGPDEHTAGYTSFFSYYYLMLLKKVKWITLYKALKSKNGGFIKSLKQFAGFLILNSLKYKPSPFINYNKFKKSPTSPNPGILSAVDNIQKYSLEQIFITSIPYQAHSEDRNSMCFSVESRSPYLDHRLLEFAVGLPDLYKIKNNTNKWILREVLKPFIPKEVYERKDKMGFVAPDEVWMRNDVSTIRAELTRAVADLKGLVTEALILNYDEFVQGKMPYTNMYFRVLGLAALIRNYDMSIEIEQ